MTQECCGYDIDSDPKEVAQLLSEPGYAQQLVAGRWSQVDEKIQIAVVSCVATGH